MNSRSMKPSDQNDLHRMPANRRDFLARAGMGMIGMAGASTLFAQEGVDTGNGPKFSDSTKTAAELITPKIERAIDQGLAYLAKAQIKTGPNKGAFGSSGADGSVAR